MSSSMTTIQTMNSTGTKLVNLTELGGRILLAHIFLLSGLSKIGAYAATAGYMESAGVPAALLPVVIATELGGSLALIIGWRTRIGAFLLAGFTLIAACIFHNNFVDQIQQMQFMKDISIAGGLLLLVARGAGPMSLDARRARQERSR